jgi:NAD(P) transhydrogenase subunit alpha
MGGATNFRIDRDNDIVRGALVLHQGEKTWPPPPPRKVEPEVKESREGQLPASAPPPTRVPAAAQAPSKHGAQPAAPSKGGGIAMAIVGIVAAVLWLTLRYGSADAAVSTETSALLQHLTVFILAVFVGWQVVWNVTPALHTPLMSVTNAISGIIVVGGILGARFADADAAVAVALAATLFATINIAGGFLVTRRMLAMFRK